MREIPGVLTYIDDVLVHCPDHPSQLETLETASLRLRKYGLKLNVAKSAFGAREVTYLGYRLTEIREVVGLANYFRFLIPNFAFYAGIMTCLTEKNSGYKGGSFQIRRIQLFCF